MPWHTARLESVMSENYAKAYLTCLISQGDSDQFYAALSEAEDLLMPILCQNAFLLTQQQTLDARLVPTLTRFLDVGGDTIFEGLCILAKGIDSPEIQKVLEGLLHRFSQRFDPSARTPQNEEATELWRGFARLIEHPLFTMVTDWPQQLERVLIAPMAWFHAQDIVRVLERDPGSYTVIEQRLFKECNWEHYRQDEVERLDQAAETLFVQTQKVH
jgi:hypothetical protein